MKGIRNHNQAIDQIALELGIGREYVAKVLSIAFSPRGIAEKVKYPNVLVLPIGTLKPRANKILHRRIRKVMLVKERQWKKRQYKSRKIAKAEINDSDEQYFFDRDYLTRLINSNFNYYPWQIHRTHRESNKRQTTQARQQDA